MPSSHRYSNSIPRTEPHNAKTAPLVGTPFGMKHKKAPLIGMPSFTFRTRAGE
jgi:hypothetical protein